MKVTGVTNANCTGVGCVNPTNSITWPVTLSTTATRIFNAAANTGKGTVVLTATYQVSYPANALPGTYSATVTLDRGDRAVARPMRRLAAARARRARPRPRRPGGDKRAGLRPARGRQTASAATSSSRWPPAAAPPGAVIVSNVGTATGTVKLFTTDATTGRTTGHGVRDQHAARPAPARGSRSPRPR